MRGSSYRFASPLAVALVMTVLGCKGSEDKPKETTLSSATVDMVATGVATDRIAAARCAREVMCASLGGIDQPFVSHENCMREASARLRADVADMRCPPVVERAPVEVCLREIGNESCNDPVDAIERLHACRMSTLCGTLPGAADPPHTRERAP